MIIEQTYLKATSISEALNIAHQNATSCKYIAGGTDIMVNKFQGNNTSECLIDLTEIEELKRVRKDETNLYIGALVRLDDLSKFAEIVNEFPVLLEAAKSVGSPLIRKTATIGGNVLCENRCIFYNQSEWWREAIGYCLKCNGDICIATGGKKACFSEFVSDTAPALIALNASISIEDIDGTKIVKLEDIYTGDGVNPRILSKTAILKEIILPLNQNIKCIFKKLRQRESLEFTALTSVVSIDKNNQIKIVLAGVDPKPVVVIGQLNDNKDDLIKKAFKGARAIDNDMLTRTYRKEMINVFLKESFEEFGI